MIGRSSKRTWNNSIHDILCNFCSQLFENDRRIARLLRLCKQANYHVSVRPASFELTNYCPVSTSSVSTSRYRSRPPSPFRSRPSSLFRSGPLPFTSYESGQPISKPASRLRNQLAGFETGWVANQALTYICSRCRVVFLSFFLALFCTRIAISCVFIPALFRTSYRSICAKNELLQKYLLHVPSFCSFKWGWSPESNGVVLAIEYQREFLCKPFCISLLWFLWTCSYTLCTGGHFEPSPSLLKKRYHTSWYATDVG